MLPTPMNLRSSVTPEEKAAVKKAAEIEVEKKRNKIPMKYKGKIKYCTDFIDCAMACDELLTMCKQSPEPLIIGFDMEWPFSFQTGSGKAALVQISPSLDMCYLLHISALRKLPAGLNALLTHPNVRLTGNNVKNDVRKLARDFRGIDGNEIIANCIDSGVLANSILPFTQRWSMAKLIDYLFNMEISKDKKVRMSKWHVCPLSSEQLHYAACDAYASLLIYQDLKKREAANNQKEDDANAANLQ